MRRLYIISSRQGRVVACHSTRHAQIGHKILHCIFCMQLVYSIHRPLRLDSQLVRILKVSGEIWRLGAPSQRTSGALLRYRSLRGRVRRAFVSHKHHSFGNAMTPRAVGSAGIERVSIVETAADCVALHDLEAHYCFNASNVEC